MGWVKTAIRDLNESGRAEFCPHGGSMRPVINSGDRVLLIKQPAEYFKVGDIALCRVSRQFLLHYIVKTEVVDGRFRFLIANGRGKTNGWSTQLFGVVKTINDVEYSPSEEHREHHPTAAVSVSDAASASRRVQPPFADST